MGKLVSSEDELLWGEYSLLKELGLLEDAHEGGRYLLEDIIGLVLEIIHFAQIIN